MWAITTTRLLFVKLFGWNIAWNTIEFFFTLHYELRYGTLTYFEYRFYDGVNKKLLRVRQRTQDEQIS